MVTPVCVLRSGGEYNASHVRWLAAQVPGLVALSDTPVEGVKVIPLKKDFPGWWSKLNLFSDAISGDLLYLDLDTVVVSSLDPLFAVGKTTVLRDFYKKHLMGSGLMYISESSKARIWEAFNTRSEEVMRTHCTRERWGDQGFLEGYIGGCQKWQDVLPGQIFSFKVDCRVRLPPTARVICFHGKPRPWDTPRAWIPKL
jgi:hypothetical protein